MLKLIGIIILALPAVLFVNSLFSRRSRRYAEVMSNFRKQLDFAVWALLVMIACGGVFAIGRLIWQLATAARP